VISAVREFYMRVYAVCLTLFVGQLRRLSISKKSVPALPRSSLLGSWPNARKLAS